MKMLLRILFTPNCWMRNHGTSKIWDKKLNELLDDPTFEKIGRHTVVLNGFEIWRENYPYCYGDRYDLSDELPKRGTVFRLHDAIEKAMCDKPV